MTDASQISPLDQARILSEALPHMQQYDEETIVIKYGGHAMGAEDTAKAFARDIVLLEQTAINPVVVHGGGPQIATMLKRLGIQSEFAAGLAHHRRRHHRDRRDGAGGFGQQAVGRLYQRGRRQGGGLERQGRQHGEGVENDAHHGRPGFEYRKSDRSWFRRRSRKSRSDAIEPVDRLRADPGAGAACDVAAMARR